MQDGHAQAWYHAHCAMAPRHKDKDERIAGITDSGVRKCAWFPENEAEALRRRAFEERRSEAAVIREAVRRFLGIKD